MPLTSVLTQKMNSLRLEADEAISQVEELKTRVKTLEQENLSKEQEITSLQHKNNLLETEVEKLEGSTKDLKALADDSTSRGTQNEALTRRLQLLEEEAEVADKTLRETNEKYVQRLRKLRAEAEYLTIYFLLDRLRQTDVKAGHFERKVQALESERDTWENKYEEMSKKYQEVQKDLEQLTIEIGNI
ncbi:uncharacterized protein MKZ38_007022 [Zalerion maritima]|uniref:Tropomyosin n=1 Tax=Zalerion maritima TaxID=339359 RepID=A0AAD5WVM2_9PEZI|nr:uncharacterized protein MKZ38_007022 [Zalerion maritima]